jgi:hypothetical protein
VKDAVSDFLSELYKRKLYFGKPCHCTEELI